MAGLRDLDHRAILDGAAVAAMIAVPLQFIAQLALDEDERSGWAAVLAMCIIGALVLGAGVAAWRQDRQTPLTHGIVTALGVYIAIQAVLTTLKLVRGDDVRWGRIVTSLALSTLAGLIGGFLGASLLRRGLEAESMSRVLVIDVGTSGTRAAIVSADGDSGVSVDHVRYRRLPPSTPFPGLVEFDAVELAAVVLDLAGAALDAGGPVDAVGITNQRASTIVWDRATGAPVGPTLGWQDLRTVGECITAKAEHGLALAPNQTATKAAWLLSTFDPTRARDLCVGTVDSWLVWVLTEGRHHVTDRSNAGVTGLLEHGAARWSTHALDAMGIAPETMPTLVDSSGPIGPATALAGGPIIAGIAGDQQASLIGQGCVRPGQAKCTFGTGGMLDVVTGPEAPASSNRGPHGTFPIVAWTFAGKVTWGAEAIMLTAGTNVDWLVDDLQVLGSAAESHDVAAAVPHSDGVVYVPALVGLGTPRWDYGARGTLLGLTRGTTRAHVVRAVLEGVAQRGADLVEAAERDACEITTLRIDGGMSENPTFVQALADACARPVEIARFTECTTLGAGFLAGLACGVWPDLDAIAATWSPRLVVEPNPSPGPGLDRENWARAVDRAAGWIPAFSALDF